MIVTVYSEYLILIHYGSITNLFVDHFEIWTLLITDVCDQIRKTNRRYQRMPGARHSKQVSTAPTQGRLCTRSCWVLNWIDLFPVLIPAAPCTGRGEGSSVGLWESYSTSWRTNRDCSDPRWPPSSLFDWLIDFEHVSNKNKVKIVVE